MVWKDVIGYEGKYIVSDQGQVKSILKNKVLTAFDNGRGYMNIGLSGPRKRLYVHRMVAIAFIENPNNLPQVNHIDGNKKNNCVHNLEWCDGFYNQRHARINFKRKQKDIFGHKNPNYKNGLKSISSKIKNCPECGNTFSNVESKRIFCSKICSQRSNARNMSKIISSLRAEMMAQR